MVIFKYTLSDGKSIETDPQDISKIVGMEELLPSIEKLKKEDGNYNLRNKNNVIEVKARDIASITFVFV
ncbi:hypothetical protein DV092_06010 [Clostridium botulinum]|nr:hypothetical protein [Clostridium botulinum]